MIPAIRFYELYTAISLHMKGGSYDFFRYNGKTSVTEKSFFARKDKYLYQKMASQFPSDDMAIDFIVANYLKGNKYIRSFNYDDYLEFISYRDGLEYKFGEDFKRLVDMPGSFYDNMLTETFTGKLPIQFMLLFNIVTKGKMAQAYDKKDNIIWQEELRKKVLTYSPFLVYTWQIIESRERDLRQLLKTT